MKLINLKGKRFGRLTVIEYKENLTIDRIDVNGNYEPSNCRWANIKEQCRNRRSNKNIKFGKQEKSLIEWCEELKVPYSRIISRLKRGWSVQKAFTATKMKNQYI